MGTSTFRNIKNKILNRRIPFCKKALGYYLWKWFSGKICSDFDLRDCEQVILKCPTNSENQAFPKGLQEFYEEKIRNDGWTRNDIKNHFYKNQTVKTISYSRKRNDEDSIHRPLS